MILENPQVSLKILKFLSFHIHHMIDLIKKGQRLAFVDLKGCSPDSWQRPPIWRERDIHGLLFCSLLKVLRQEWLISHNKNLILWAKGPNLPISLLVVCCVPGNEVVEYDCVEKFPSLSSSQVHLSG